jgi:hypothetical protein
MIELNERSRLGGQRLNKHWNCRERFAMSNTSRLLSTGLLALTVFAASPLQADARGYKGYNGLDQGYVVAHSRYGNGTVSGPVRDTRLGPQVRLPGGAWEYCRRSCSETLRVETVDFWEAQQDGGGLAAECGIFGCLDIHIGRRRY